MYSVIVMGHPFMTFTWKGEGVRLRWTHVECGGGEGGQAPCGRRHRISPKSV